jgi:predicted dehydrogenase
MIGIGLIGYGYWGPNLARCFADGDKSRLAAVHDQDPAALERAARRYPGARACADVAALLAEPTVDAVAIATPVYTHFDLALAALRAGKHVLVEKPMTRTSAEAAQLIEEAQRRKLVLMVDHTFVYTPAVRKVRELIEAGELGCIHYYDSTRVNLGLFQSDVNVVWDLAVHDLAILDHILDENPVSIAAQAVRHVQDSPESMAFVTLGFPSGAVAHINVNWLAPVKVRQTLIGGSKKMIVYNDLEPSEKIKLYDKGITVLSPAREEIDRLRIGYRTGDMWAPRLATTEALQTEADHFVDCVDQAATPLTDGAAGLRVVELLELATGSIRQGGHPVDLTLTRMAS